MIQRSRRIYDFADTYPDMFRKDSLEENNPKNTSKETDIFNSVLSHTDVGFSLETPKKEEKQEFKN